MALEATLDVSVDEDVQFDFEVSNTSEEPIEVTFRSSKVADIVVFDGGDEVWRWGEDKMFAQVMKTTTMGPGDHTSETFTWADPPSGEFEAVGTLESDPGAEASESFSV